MRYAWDLYHQYLKETNYKGLKKFYAQYVLSKMRIWDVASANRVDHFIANSSYIQSRIKKVYNRNADIIYPPVNVLDYTIQKEKDDYYFTASRMVPYKKMDLIVRAFNNMPNKKLIVAGDGPEYNHIKKIAKSNIEIKGFLDGEHLKGYLQNAKAFVFAAEEDFGIIPVEAQACGTPVIGFNKGGLKETVIDKKTGLLFDYQTPECVTDAVKHFETLKFDADIIRQNALKFSKERFELEIEAFVNQKFSDFKSK